MRVIAGELGGRRLISPPDDSVRPTSDRAREALFSILGEVEGLSVLDLCCGTGALSIEALSRGADRATMVDTETAPAAVNVEAFDLDGRVSLLRQDGLEFLRGGDSRFDLILCDPPYKIAARFEPELPQLAPARLAPGGTLVLESNARDAVPLEFDGLELMRERRYGSTLLRIWRNP
ncbi:16S rRNA (guanine(966)-N(2))-methyltransferase RsmD [soil metagenome]